MCQLLSVIVPCYNEEESLSFFYERIQQVAAQLLEKHHLKTSLLTMVPKTKPYHCCGSFPRKTPR